MCLRYFNITPNSSNTTSYMEWTIPKQNWLTFVKKHLKGRINNDLNI